MSSIEKMTIQGIRSYGPKEKDTQVIEFFFPVTLIIGQNGSGKTTIIECLKYATTGDMPPNTKGSSFVFDPKLIDEIETKGRIKLYFRDTSDLYVQVQKNLCSTQKAKKLEFRTIETIISRYSKENKLLSTITSKCINADAEIVNAFGVSKAVLEHVIFCHQEDSNWPLSDGKLLKTRFDEIFAATKYIKALDCLKKIRLEKSQIIKQKEVEKKFLEASKNRAEQLNKDLSDNTVKIENLKTKKQTILEKLQPINKQIDFYFQESARILEVKSQLDKIENEKNLLEKQIKELYVSMANSLFQGTEEELKETIKEFETKTNTMRKDQEEMILKQIEELNVKLKEKNHMKSKLTIEMGAVENKNKICIENKQKLVSQISKAAELMNLDEIETSGDYATSQTDRDNFIKKMNDFIHDYQTETNSIEEVKKQEDANAQTKIEQERDSKSKMDQKIQNKKDLIEKNKKQLEQIQNELQYISNDSLINELNANINKCETELQTKSQNLGDVGLIKKEIAEHEENRSKLRHKELKLDSKINEMHSNAKHQTEVDLLKQDKQSKDEQIRKIRLRIKDEIENFFDEEDDSLKPSSKELNNDINLKSLFEIKYKKVLTDLNGFETKQKDIDKRLCSNELKRKMCYDELRQKESQLREYEDKLLQLDDCILCQDDIEKFDSILEKLQENNKNFLDEKGFMNGVDKTYKRFLTQLQESKSITEQLAKSVDSDCVSCPVCLRLFKDQSELDDTIRELKKYTSKLPQKMKDLDAKIVESELKIQKMINMKPIKESYENIKNNEIANIKSQVESYDRNVLPKIKNELKNNQESLKKLEQLKSCSDLIQNEIVLIDKYANESKDLEKKIQIQNKTLNDLNASISQNDLDELEIDSKRGSILNQLNEQKSKIQNEMQALNIQIQSKQDELNKNYTLHDLINNLKEKLNSLKTKRNDLESKMQKKTQLTDKQQELRNEIDESQLEINDLSVKLKTLINLICDLTAKRQEKLNKNKELFKQRSKLANDLNLAKSVIEELALNIQNFENNESNRLTSLKKEIKSKEKEENEINIELKSLRESLDELKLELARYELKHRELCDNLRLKQKIEELKLKEELYEKKKDEIQMNDAKLDLKSFKIEQAKVEAKRDELNKELQDIKTQMNIIEGKLETIQDELEQDAYKNALEKYTVCACDLLVLEVTVNDIEKYHKALDRAVMNYHQLKMNEINKTIKQLWRQVYKGNDIDYIEIRSEEEAANDEPIKTRRVYNYRVVLVKGDTALDMRGRCSAGQKGKILVLYIFKIDK